MYETLLDISAWIIPVVIAITFHEAAHGYMARRFGDMTATVAGRVSLNPIRHVDRFGTVVLPGLLWATGAPFLFGYAKPVPVDFSQLKPGRLGMIMVALAGPGTNLILAFLAALALHIEQWVTPEEAKWLFLNLYRMLMINCVLAVFNMLPVLPLDGGRVLNGLLPPSLAEKHAKTEKWGILLVLLLIIAPFLADTVTQLFQSGPALPPGDEAATGWLFGIDPAEYLIARPSQWLVETIIHLVGLGNTDGV